MREKTQTASDNPAALADRYLELWFANLAAWAAESDLEDELSLSNLARNIAATIGSKSGSPDPVSPDPAEGRDDT